MPLSSNHELLRCPSASILVGLASSGLLMALPHILCTFVRRFILPCCLMVAMAGSCSNQGWPSQAISSEWVYLIFRLWRTPRDMVLIMAGTVINLWVRRFTLERAGTVVTMGRHWEAGGQAPGRCKFVCAGPGPGDSRGWAPGWTYLTCSPIWL